MSGNFVLTGMSGNILGQMPIFGLLDGLFTDVRNVNNGISGEITARLNELLYAESTINILWLIFLHSSYNYMHPDEFLSIKFRIPCYRLFLRISCIYGEYCMCLCRHHNPGNQHVDRLRT